MVGISRSNSNYNVVTCIAKLARSRLLAVQDMSLLPDLLSEHALHREGRRQTDQRAKAIRGVVREGRARKKRVAMPRQ